jgi:hypothetical protein
MADPFSYESDIAPLRGNNFGGAISPAYFAQQKFLREGVDVAREASAVRIAEIQQAAQRQQIAFEEAQLNLQKTRKQIQDQLDLEEALPKIEPMLTALIDNPNMDTPTKILEAEKMRLGYAKFGSPLVNNFFDNTIKALGTKDVNEALRKQAAYRAAELGDKSAAQTIAGTGTEAAQTLGVLADTVKQKQQQELESAQQQKLFEKRLESQEEKEKGKTAVLKDQLDYIQKLSPAKDELTAGDKEWGTGTTGTTDVTKPFLKEIDRRILFKMYKARNPLAADLDEGDIPNDSTLVTDVYGKLYDEYTARTGTKPASKISEKSK